MRVDAVKSDVQEVLDWGYRILREYEQIEAAFSSSGYAQLSGRLDSLQRLFDGFAALLRKLPEPSKEVLEVKQRVALCYRGFSSLCAAWDRLSADLEEERDFAPEEEPEGEEPSLEEPEEDDAEDDAPEEEQEEASPKKRAKKPEQSYAERQRQEARRAAASAIYGQHVDPQRQYSESDIQTAELRWREEIRRKELQEAENRRIRQESIESYRQKERQSRGFQSPSGHIDMSFHGKQEAKEPENPSHPAQPEENSGTHPPGNKQEGNEHKDDRYQKEQQEIAAALGIPISAVQSMTSASLRFWKNRLRNADAFSDRPHGASEYSREKKSQEAEAVGASQQTNASRQASRPDTSGGASRSFHPPDARSSEAVKRHYEKRVEAAAALGLPLEKVLGMTDHELQKAKVEEAHRRQTGTYGAAVHSSHEKASAPGTAQKRPLNNGSAGTQDEQKGKESSHVSKRYKLKQIADILLIAGIKVGEATFDLGKNAAFSIAQNVGNEIVSSNDALNGISTGSYYLGTAGAAARAVVQHNPTTPLRRSASRQIGKDYPQQLNSEYVKQQFGKFKREKTLDGKMVEQLRNEKGKIPRSAKGLQAKAQQVEKDFRAAQAKKYGGANLQRSRNSLTTEIKDLKEKGATIKNRLKFLEGKGKLSATERQELMSLRAALKNIGKRVSGLTGTLQAKEDIAYVSRRLQGVTRRAYRNKQALGNASRLARSFMLRPLVAGSESNTEGLYYANRIASDPLTRSGMRIGYRAARWTIRRPFWLAHKIAPKTYDAVAHKVESAAHAVAAVPKNLAFHAKNGIKKAISNIMPKGVKTGIKRIQSTFAVAKTGVHNAVFRANAWLANTKLGHAATTVRVVGRGAAEALRSAGAVLKAAGAKVLLFLGLFLLICVAAASFIPNIVAGSAGGVILSPAESTSGKINLAPYCMVYGSEAKRFDNELAALLRKYSDTEKYESVQVNYSDISMNAKEILSMMAVHLQQSLDMDKNPDVKSYISYMFRQSHVYSVYEHVYYCEGCEQRPTGVLIDKVVMVDGKPVMVDGKPVVEKVPEMEDYCPGHIDVTITVNVYGFDEIFGLDQYPASNDWDGWTQDNKDWCKIIYNMDWNELYEGLEYLSSGSVTGIAGSAYEQQIWNFLMDLIGNEYGAAGLMGNLYCESGLNPTNLQDSYELSLGYNNDTYTAAVDSGTYSEVSFVNDSAGYGLAQWTWSGRKQGLYTYCTSRGLSIGSIDGQLGYLSTELTGSFSGCLSDLRNAGSVEEGSRIAMLRFEAPLDQSASAQAVRQQYAEYFYNKMVFGVASEGNLTQKQQEVIHIAMNSASYGIAARPGYCQAWAAYVYAKAGLPIDNSSCAYQSGVRFGVSSDFSNVPPGAAVYGYSGSKYGHVGIYVGNGLVYHNIGRVAVDSLSDWISIYKGFCWGWEAGSDLTTYD